MTQTNIEQGDIFWVNLSPTAGHEQAGNRPVMVVSSNHYQRLTSFVTVCPITTTPRPYPMHVELPDSLSITGNVLCEQVRSLDFSARNARFIEKVSQETLDQVLLRVKAIFEK